jgi:hypothetical protein
MNGGPENQMSEYAPNVNQLTGISQEKRCKTCGIIKPLNDFYKGTKTCVDGYFGNCKQCCQINQKIYRSTHKEAINNRHKEYRKTHKNEINIAIYKWQNKNRERHLENRKKWRDKNREKNNAIARLYYNANREIIHETQHKWAKSNPDKINEKKNRRRARKYNGTVEIFRNVDIFERDKWICQLCKKKVNKRLKAPHPLSPSLDHIVPLSKGGSHERKNVQLVHLLCNSKAGIGGIKQLLLFG